jgi:signal transduction histidine kinase/CheY-like chemotaxis protein
LYNNLLESLVDIENGAHSAQFRIEAQPKAVAVSLAPITFGAEGLPSTVVVLRDISREAEIERLKNEFISTVSHELRTPMTSIKGYADLLLTKQAQIGELNPQQLRFIKIIQSNANRLTDLVNDILEISRIETGRIKLTLTSLNTIKTLQEIALSFEAQMAEKEMNFSVNLPSYLPNIYSDKARLTQILVNLISNAWQYTPQGGHINIYAKVAGDFVQIDVEDDGIGIVEQDLAYIFDRFFRSERTEVQVVDGTGLGLSITRAFVEMLGGKIWVKSRLDVGTTFSFTIPLDRSHEQGRFEPLNLPVEPQILIISDDQPAIKMLTAELEKQNYKTVVLNNGQLALDFMRQAGHAVNLIFLDLALNDTNGFELIAHLQSDESTAAIPVILAPLFVDPTQRCLFAQVIDYIAVVLEEPEIVERIKSNFDFIRAESGPQLPGARNRGRILLIENNWTTSDRLREILVKSGYQVQCAYNGRQALDMAVGGRPELILAGQHLPKIDGETILSQLRQTNGAKDIPVVIVTQQPLEFAQGKLVALKRDKLSHPLSGQTLISAIQQAT